MSKKSSYLFGIVLTIIFGTLLYLWIGCCCYNSLTCNQKEPLKENVVVQPEIKHSLNPFTFKEGEYEINENDNFNFKASGFKILQPLSDNVTNAVLKLKTYFDENPSKNFNITGYYTSDEENNSAYPNLGLARANAVKNHVVSLGIPSKQINTFGELKDGLIPDAESVYHGPIDYGALTLADGANSDAELEAIALEIKDKPLLLYFETGAATLRLTPEQRIKVAKISRYLDKVDDSFCIIVGHTDNTGTPENNMVLGQERADFAKSYLVRNHIPENNISATSKGQNSPIADNNTDEGRAKNRRIVVTIK